MVIIQGQSVHCSIVIYKSILLTVPVLRYLGFLFTVINMVWKTIVFSGISLFFLKVDICHGNILPVVDIAFHVFVQFVQEKIKVVCLYGCMYITINI